MKAKERSPKYSSKPFNQSYFEKAMNDLDTTTLANFESVPTLPTLKAADKNKAFHYLDKMLRKVDGLTIEFLETYWCNGTNMKKTEIIQLFRKVMLPLPPSIKDTCSDVLNGIPETVTEVSTITTVDKKYAVEDVETIVEKKVIFSGVQNFYSQFKGKVLNLITFLSLIGKHPDRDKILTMFLLQIRQEFPDNNDIYDLLGLRYPNVLVALSMYLNIEEEMEMDTVCCLLKLPKKHPKGKSIWFNEFLAELNKTTNEDELLQIILEKYKEANPNSKKDSINIMYGKKLLNFLGIFKPKVKNSRFRRMNLDEYIQEKIYKGLKYNEIPKEYMVEGFPLSKELIELIGEGYIEKNIKFKKAMIRDGEVQGGMGVTTEEKEVEKTSTPEIMTKNINDKVNDYIQHLMKLTEEEIQAISKNENVVLNIWLDCAKLGKKCLALEAWNYGFLELTEEEKEFVLYDESIGSPIRRIDVEAFTEYLNATIPYKVARMKSETTELWKKFFIERCLELSETEFNDFVKIYLQNGADMFRGKALGEYSDIEYGSHRFSNVSEKQVQVVEEEKVNESQPIPENEPKFVLYEDDENVKLTLEKQSMVYTVKGNITDDLSSQVKRKLDLIKELMESGEVEITITVNQ